MTRTWISFLTPYLTLLMKQCRSWRKTLTPMGMGTPSGTQPHTSRRLYSPLRRVQKHQSVLTSDHNVVHG